MMTTQTPIPTGPTPDPAGPTPDPASTPQKPKRKVRTGALGIDHFYLTDAGNAQRFEAHMAGRLMWVDDGDRGHWREYTGLYWTRRTVDHVHTLAVSAARATREVGALRRNDDDGALFLHSDLWEGHARLVACTTGARGRLEVPGADLDLDIWHLNTADGALDLRTGVVRPARAADYETRVVNHLGQPARYVEVDDLRVPELWKRYAEDAHPPEVWDFIWEVLGYAACGSDAERLTFWFQGETATGKTTLLEVVSDALGGRAGGYVTQSNADVIMAGARDRDADAASPTLAGWRGKRVVWCDEVNDGRRLDAGKLKQVTGGGEIVARDLYQRGRDAHTFRATHTVVATVNHLPTVAGAHDAALWSRVLCVPWLHAVPKVDRTLKQRLREDPAVLRYVLAQIVAGAMRWHASYDKRGSGFARIPDAVVAATEAWRGESDGMAQWLRDRCHVGAGLHSKFADLHASHTTWCLDTNRRSLQDRAFGAALRTVGITKDRRADGNFWLGVEVISANT